MRQQVLTFAPLAAAPPAPHAAVAVAAAVAWACYSLALADGEMLVVLLMTSNGRRRNISRAPHITKSNISRIVSPGPPPQQINNRG